MKLGVTTDYKPRNRKTPIIVIGTTLVLIGALVVYSRIQHGAVPDNTDKTSTTNQPVVRDDFSKSTPESPTKDSEQPTSSAGKYYLHEGIIATVFWAGEGADNSNDYIHNRSSAWVGDWVKSFGGIDNPEDRCDYRPCSFVPNENTFYFALPFSDYNDSGIKPNEELSLIPWYAGEVRSNESILKNRWIEIIYGEKKAYAQWEDVGPFAENDFGYVFGTNRPSESRAGIDLSPATADYLGVDGRGVVNWRFVEYEDVPDGPWKILITATGPQH